MPALLLSALVLIFVRIPAYALVGLGVLTSLDKVIDFNRLRRAGSKEAIPLAAGIFLDVLNTSLRLFARSS